MERAYLDTKQAAQLLGVSASWLAKARIFGGGPKFIKIGGPHGRVLYDVSVLHDWTRSRVHGSTSEYNLQAGQKHDEEAPPEVSARNSPKGAAA